MFIRGRTGFARLRAVRATFASRRFAAVATAALVFDLVANEERRYANERDANPDQNHDLPRAHACTSPRARRRKRSLPLFLKTMSVTVPAIAAAQRNAVHHKLPTVYTAALTTKLAAIQNNSVRPNFPFPSSALAVAQAAKQGTVVMLKAINASRPGTDM